MKPKIPQPSREWREKHLGLDEDHHPRVHLMAKSGEWFCHYCLRDNRELGCQWVIAGSVGCGKTHIAERIVNYIGPRQIDAGSRGWYRFEDIYAPVLIRWETTCGWNRAKWDDYLDSEVKSARLVVVDDLGAEVDLFKTGEPVERMKRLLDVCRFKWLLVTTNVPKQNWNEAWGPRVEDRLSAARYQAMFDVPSYRKKRKEVAA